jgi:CotS family spore coat protein
MNKGGGIMVRETEISNQFGFRIYDCIPKKGVYLLKTDKGDKCLKKISYGIQKLNYIYKAKNHIISNGFERVDRYNLSLNNNPYALVNEDIYIVTDWIDAKEADFKVLEDVKIAARTLAKFHIAARGFDLEENLKVRCDVGKLPYTLEKRLRTLKKMKHMAEKSKKKTEFDMLYLSSIDSFYELAKKAYETINMESYKKVCDMSLNKKVLCHHDYTYHNILIKNSDEVYLVDFDYLKSEVQVYDLSTLIVKTLKRVDWNIDYAVVILKEYSAIRELTSDEKEVLKTLLKFPQRFWRLANRYYYKEAAWTEATFLKKMKEIVDEKDRYLEFLSKLDEIL